MFEFWHLQHAPRLRCLATSIFDELQMAAARTSGPACLQHVPLLYSIQLLALHASYSKDAKAGAYFKPAGLRRVASPKG